MMVAAEPIMPVKKLKIKFGSRAVEIVQQPATDGCGYKKFESENSRSAISSHGRSGVCSSSESSSMLRAHKRGPQQEVEGPPKKLQKMDRNITKQCSLLLRTLMEHRFGWIFNQPVDPVKLNIPDYFSVISRPMDLGTVKCKLGKNMYHGMDDFAADIRLTFSNAMVYNPPRNDVHQMAKTLRELFEARWKSLEQKMRLETPKVGAARELVVNGLSGPGGAAACEKLQPNFKPLDVRYKRAPLDARSSVVKAEVKVTKTSLNSTSDLIGKSLHKGADSRGSHACGSDDAKKPLSSAAVKCGSCGSVNLLCRSTSISTCACSSDMTFEKTFKDNCSDSSITAKVMSLSQSKSDPDSDGAVSSVDDGHACHSSQATVSATDTETGEGGTNPVQNVQMSPTKALRAAMLKSRFADTILKARQRTLLDHVNKTDPLKVQQEKERLEKRHLEEKARIEAEIRAAEDAMRLRAEMESKKELERQREAARVALQQMKKTVIEENLEVQMELEMLFGFEKITEAYNDGAYMLQKLGLFMKDDQMPDEAEDCEDGEIF